MSQRRKKSIKNSVNSPHPLPPPSPPPTHTKQNKLKEGCFTKCLMGKARLEIVLAKNIIQTTLVGIHRFKLFTHNAGHISSYGLSDTLEYIAAVMRLLGLVRYFSTHS